MAIKRYYCLFIFYAVVTCEKLLSEFGEVLGWDEEKDISDCGFEGYAGGEWKGVKRSTSLDLSIVFLPKQHTSIKALLHLETPLLVRSTLFWSDPYNLRY